MSKLNSLLKLLNEENSSWWDSLSKEQQSDYIANHPNSKYAVNAKKKTKNASIKSNKLDSYKSKIDSKLDQIISKGQTKKIGQLAYNIYPKIVKELKPEIEKEYDIKIKDGEMGEYTDEPFSGLRGDDFESQYGQIENADDLIAAIKKEAISILGVSNNTKKKDNKVDYSDLKKAEKKANDINASDKELEALANHERDWIRIAVANNPNVPKKVLLKLAKDKNSEVRYSVASSWRADSDILTKLSKDESPSVLQAVAGNPNTPTDILNKLANDEDEIEIIRKTAKKNLSKQKKSNMKESKLISFKQFRKLNESKVVNDRTTKFDKKTIDKISKFLEKYCANAFADAAMRYAEKYANGPDEIEEYLDYFDGEVTIDYNKLIKDIKNKLNISLDKNDRAEIEKIMSKADVGTVKIGK